MTPQDIQTLIERSLNTTFVLAESADNVHFYLTVVSEDFENISKIKQHKMVKDLFKQQFADESIHAMSLKTLTPTKWAARQADTAPRDSDNS